MDTFDQLFPDVQRKVRALGAEVAKVPMTYATPVYFGDMTQSAAFADIRNGTGSLIAIESTRLCITNWHVLDEYRARKALNSHVGFQIGNIRVDPDELLVSESEHYDLAVLNVSNWSAREIASRGNVPTQFLEMRSWSPCLPKKGDFVMFGGYPGYWREATGTRALRFDTLSSGATEVYEAREDNIICLLKIDQCLQHQYVAERDGAGELTGLSGGPVLIEQRSDSGIHTFEPVGIIYEYSKSIDALYIRPLSLVSSYGIISNPPL